MAARGETFEFEGIIQLGWFDFYRATTYSVHSSVTCASRALPMSYQEVIPATNLDELQAIIDAQDEILLMPTRFPNLLFRCLVRDLKEFERTIAATGRTGEPLARALALPSLRGPLMVLRGIWSIILSTNFSSRKKPDLEITDQDLLHGLSVLKSFWTEEHYIRFNLCAALKPLATYRRVLQDTEFMYVTNQMVMKHQGEPLSKVDTETPTAASFTRYVWSRKLQAHTVLAI